MSDLPCSLLASIEKIEFDKSPYLILIRHTNREKIIENSSGFNVSITGEGKVRAIDLGKRLNDTNISWSKTSPLPRCVQTIQSISHGYGKEIPNSFSSILGEPGPFVFDGEVALKSFIDLGTEKLVRDMIKGRTFPGIRSSSEGSEHLLKGISEMFIQNPGNGICISHDAILMPFIATYCQEVFHNDWLRPLDGVIIEKSGNGLNIWWNGIGHEVIL
jgi:broad specificity phosphatase PhoE